MFTPEEAKGHGLRDDWGEKGKGTVFQTRGLPLYVHPLSEPCEGGRWAANFGGLIVELSSYSLFYWG